ncbi:MAG: hypothetical protein KatS3mg111_3763 [Pirellulaceae bacterium]|nr:MAG: hypothetical protein KatS3mg111_3763 [Pirellulaceae bacterium]
MATDRVIHAQEEERVHILNSLPDVVVEIVRQVAPRSKKNRQQTIFAQAVYFPTAVSGQQLVHRPSIGRDINLSVGIDAVGHPTRWHDDEYRRDREVT